MDEADEHRSKREPAVRRGLAGADGWRGFGRRGAECALQRVEAEPDEHGGDEQLGGSLDAVV